MEHEGVLAGPMNALRMKAESEDRRVRMILAHYPNLEAVLDGRVSGVATEWPMIRVELRRLTLRLDDAEQGHAKEPSRG